MSLHYYRDLVQGSGEWLDARRGLVTASTIGKLITPTLKLANNDTSRGLLLTLAAERITGHVDYVHPTWDMQRGTDDEPYAREAYREHYGPVDEVGFITYTNNRYTLGYSPDGLVGDDGLIEIKSRRPNTQIAAFLNGAVPAANMAQLQAGMFVTGRKWCEYISYSAGLPLFVKRVEADPAWFAVIDEAASAAESAITHTIANFASAAAGAPATERRPEIEEIRI